MKFSIVALALVALLVTACSDDPVTPPAPDKFVVTTMGTYYVSSVDSVNNNPADTANPTYSAAGKDSTYIEGTTSVAGRTAVIFRGNYTHNGTTTYDTTYMAQDGNAIFQYYTLGVSDIPGITPITAGKTWVRIGDNGASTWTALDTLISNVSFTYGGQTLVANVDVDMQGSKVGTHTITIGGTAHSANHFRVKGVIFIDHAFAKIRAYTQEDFWFVKNVGMVKYERGVTTLDGGILFTGIKVSGKRETATSFKVL